MLRPGLVPLVMARCTRGPEGYSATCLSSILALTVAQAAESHQHLMDQDPHTQPAACCLRRPGLQPPTGNPQHGEKPAVPTVLSIRARCTVSWDSPHTSLTAASEIQRRPGTCPKPLTQLPTAPSAPAPPRPRPQSPGARIQQVFERPGLTVQQQTVPGLSVNCGGGHPSSR